MLATTTRQMMMRAFSADFLNRLSILCTVNVNRGDDMLFCPQLHQS